MNNKDYNIDLKELLNRDDDSISGRSTGSSYAEKHKITDKIKHNIKIKITIPEQVEVISDSFWKGFYNEVMEEVKSKNKLEENICIIGDDFFKDASSKNLIILDAIYNK